MRIAVKREVGSEWDQMAGGAPAMGAAVGGSRLLHARMGDGIFSPG